MQTVNIIIADDQKTTHENIYQSLSSLNFKFKILENFYDLGALKDYLFDSLDPEDGPDILILDNIFDSSMENTGINALVDIREAAPKLPILMLSTMSDDDRLFSDARDEYDIDYIQKPVKSSDLRFRIESIIRNMDKWDSLHEKITENKEFIEFVASENDRLNVEISQNKIINQKLLNDIEEERSALFKKIVPIDLIQSIFTDVEILPKAFRFLAKGGVKHADWIKIFRCLKVIDWKNVDCNQNGISIEKFHEGINWGYKNIWEYRFSRGGRIFVERGDNTQIPQIVLIDPNHMYSDLSSF